jgi:hypothetical protein
LFAAAVAAGGICNLGLLEKAWSLNHCTTLTTCHRSSSRQVTKFIFLDPRKSPFILNFATTAVLTSNIYDQHLKCAAELFLGHHPFNQGTFF